MQHIRESILKHLRVTKFAGDGKLLIGAARHMCAAPNLTDSDHIMARVINLVKKYDKLEASKVTETADFQKDLSLDSLDRVELVMALEEEFSIEIPDEKADKLSCCADVVKYILSEAKLENAQGS